MMRQNKKNNKKELNHYINGKIKKIKESKTKMVVQIQQVEIKILITLQVLII